MGTGTTERPKTTENITVYQVGQYGVRVDEKTWFGVNSPLTPQHFVPDTGYKVAVTVSKTGKKYIAEILGTEDKSATVAPAPAAAPAATDAVKAAEEALAKAKAAAAAPAPAPKPAAPATSGKPYRAGYDKPLSEYDLGKDKQISRSGIYQAALQSPAIGQWAVNVDEYLALVRKVAEAGMKFIQE